MPYDTLDQQTIIAVVEHFYRRVHDDPRLGPIFERAVAGRWPEHLATMVMFWSSVMLGSGDYQGRPMQSHMRIPELDAALFDHWLRLFGDTTAAVLTPDLAAAFNDKAARMAHSLKRGLDFRPTPARPLAQPLTGGEPGGSA